MMKENFECWESSSSIIGDTERSDRLADSTTAEIINDPVMSATTFEHEKAVRRVGAVIAHSKTKLYVEFQGQLQLF